MKTYRALVTLPELVRHQLPSRPAVTYEAKEKLEAQYGKGNVTNPYEV